jgi:CHAD domain-containing protein
MTYRFKLQEPIGQGVRRIALEQIEIAEAKLSSKDDVSAAIHDARRCLKRVRALLRLIRPGLEDGVYQREAAHLAGIGKLLSGARDLDVMRQTLSKLEVRFDAMPAGAAERLAKLVGHGHGLGRRTAADGRRQALLRLGKSKRLFATKGTAGIELGHLIRGLGNTYRKARTAFRHAYLEPSDESFHLWRKRVQQHWRHMALLSRGWPEAMAARASEAKELSRLLGEDHDHAILIAFARERGASILESEDIGALTTMCRSCQAELRAAARPRGERLLAEPTKNLEERVALYWTSAQSLAALAPANSAPAARQAPNHRVKSARYRKR